MTEERLNPLVIAVTIEDREDGGVRVSSRELIGLHLAGRDREAVWNMIPSAIKVLLERNHGKKVESVRPSVTLEEAVKALPKDVHMHVVQKPHVEQKSFVIELVAA